MAATATEYMVLASEGGGEWAALGRITGHGQADALRKWFGADAGANMPLYVAVPMRSWQPVKVERETKVTTRLLSAATAAA